MGKNRLSEYREILIKILWVLFPVILFLFPFVNLNQGVDLTDAGYSLGNYRFFPSQDGTWAMATFLSNVTGYFFTKLPFGHTMLGVKFYSTLLVSFMALLGYRFFSTKMPKSIAFAAQLAAVGLCWCPVVILYNYMTYVLLLMGAVLLFRGLAGERPGCLVLAGVCLGMNIFVRFPNILQAALILAVWYYGIIRKKSFKEVVRETLFCLLGYLLAVVGMLTFLMIYYGPSAYFSMITGLFSMTGEAADYTPLEMVLSILDAYWHGFRWLLYMLVCVLPGIPFFILYRHKFLTLKKIIYGICIAFLFYVLGRWGMYNFRYYQKEAALQWAVVFLLVSAVVMSAAMISRGVDWFWKLIACISLLIMLITPLGSNNHVWPVINNLFFIAPVTFWMVYKYVRWGRSYVATSVGDIPMFPLKAMLTGIMAAFFIQSLGVGCFYVFLDGEGGEKRTAVIQDNPVAGGMVTTRETAEALEGMSVFVRANYRDNPSLLLYGNIPALSYYLDTPPAIFTSWPDLDSNPLSTLERDLEELKTTVQKGTRERPLVILPLFPEQDQGDEKFRVISGFMAELDYQEVYKNEKFKVFY